MILRTVSKTTGRIHCRVERTNAYQWAAKIAASLYLISEPTASIGDRQYLAPPPLSANHGPLPHRRQVRARQRAKFKLPDSLQGQPARPPLFSMHKRTWLNN